MYVMGSKDISKKHPRESIVVEMHSDIRIPTHIFRNTSLSVLESVVDYLKEHHGLGFREIAILLDRDERNIWTVHRRAASKK